MYHRYKYKIKNCKTFRGKSGKTSETLGKAKIFRSDIKNTIHRSCLVAQQIKDLACHCSGSGHCCGVGLILGPETSTCHRHGQKQTKNNSNTQFIKEVGKLHFIKIRNNCSVRNTIKRI